MSEIKNIPASSNLKQAVQEEKIAETEFTEVIDYLYKYVHCKSAKNATIKMYPDLKISQFKDFFNL